MENGKRKANEESDDIPNNKRREKLNENEYLNLEEKIKSEEKEENNKVIN